MPDGGLPGNAVTEEIIKRKMGSDEAAATETALDVISGFFNPSPDKLKGVDAYIEGIFQDMGEYFEQRGCERSGKYLNCEL